MNLVGGSIASLKFYTARRGTTYRVTTYHIQARECWAWRRPSVNASKSPQEPQPPSEAYWTPISAKQEETLGLGRAL